MATAIPNPAFTSISGRIGSFVFYRRKKTQCVRVYVVPGNPNTPSQRCTRTTFADAVKSWQSLTAEEQYKYTRKARGSRMSGYNLYISEYIKEKKSNYKLKPELKISFPYLINQHASHRRILSVSASILIQSNEFSPATGLHLCRGLT